MSFGFGIGDFVALSSLALKIHDRFRDSCGEYEAIATELCGFYVALDGMARKDLSRAGFEKEKAKNVSALKSGCEGLLKDLNMHIQEFECLGKTSKGFRSKTEKIYKKIAWDADVVDQLRARIVSNTVLLNSVNQRIERSAILLRVGESIYIKSTNIWADFASDKIDILNAQVRDKCESDEYEDIIKTLSPLEFSSQQAMLANKRQTETGSWLLRSLEFRAWVDANETLLVCQGMPGAGKTVLASLVVDYLQDLPGRDDIGIAYLYCDYKSQAEQTSTFLIGSLLKQLLQQQVSLTRKVSSDCHDKIKKRPNMSEREVFGLLQSLVGELPSVFVVVDALDELSTSNNVRQKILEYIATLHSAHRVKIMTTSRHIPSLLAKFDNPTSLEIRASAEDIRRYVQTRTTDLANCVHNSPDLQKAIVTAIVDAADGMFLMAKLNMDSLIDRLTPAAVKKALRDLPKGFNALDDAYDEAMERINAQKEGYRVIANQLLGWLTYAKRLMSTTELLHALAIEVGEHSFDIENLNEAEEVVGACAGLAVLDKETSSMRFVHYTTQEFFDQHGHGFFPHARQQIAMKCLTYMLYDIFHCGWIGEEAWYSRLVRFRSRHISDENLYVPQFKSENSVESGILQGNQGKRYGLDDGGDPEQYDEILHNFARRITNEYPEHFPVWVSLGVRGQRHSVLARKMGCHFLEYAASFWATHAEECTETSVIDLVKKLAEDDFCTSNAVQVAWDLYHDGDGIHGSEISKPNSFNAVHALVYFGCKAVILKLLERGVEIDIADVDNLRPLHWAAWRGHDKLVELFLSRTNMNVNSNGTYEKETPLHIAAKRSHAKIVNMLLARKDTDVNVPNRLGKSPLLCVVCKGLVNMFNILLDRTDIQVELADAGDGRTPLTEACLDGRENIVTTLLHRGNARVDSRDLLGRTPLIIAASQEFSFLAKYYSAIVGLLLERPEVQVNARDRQGYTALSVAADRGEVPVVKTLLGCHGIDVNAKDNTGRTPLERACQSSFGTSAVIGLLLKHPGVEVKSAELQDVMASSSSDAEECSIDANEEQVGHAKETTQPGPAQPASNSESLDNNGEG